MKLTNLFGTLLKENLLDEDYPTSFDMEYFKRLPSFNARIKYCQQELQRISSGSSRIVYKIDDEKVLKLAKNNAGIAQCRTEEELTRNDWYSAALAETFESHEDNQWIEMELARPVKLSQFKQILGMDLPDIFLYMNHYYNDSVKHDRRYRKPSEFNDDVFQAMWEDEFFSQMFGLMGDYNIKPGDFARKSSYGLVNRDGADTIVIIDFGITGADYDTYYS